jgi:hypothetical protein
LEKVWRKKELRLPFLRKKGFNEFLYSPQSSRTTRALTLNHVSRKPPILAKAYINLNRIPASIPVVIEAASCCKWQTVFLHGLYMKRAEIAAHHKFGFRL